MLSPVSMDSSAEDSPEITSPSAGMRSPASTRTVSPTRSSSTDTSTKAPPRFTEAVCGTIESRDFTAFLDFSRQSCSMPSESSKSAITMAPSAQLPVRKAPATASAMRALMLKRSLKNEAKPFFRVFKPESATAASARTKPAAAAALTDQTPEPIAGPGIPAASSASGMISAQRANAKARPSRFQGIRLE